MTRYVARIGHWQARKRRGGGATSDEFSEQPLDPGDQFVQEWHHAVDVGGGVCSIGRPCTGLE